MITKELITLSISDIKPYDRNPRLNEDAVEDVKESIRQCEALVPIEVDEHNVILSGHTRHKALSELGYEQIECIRYTGLTEAQKKKYRLLANKVAEKSQWDIGMLTEELDDIDFEGYDFDFDIFDTEDMADNFEIEEEESEYFTTKLTFPKDKEKQIKAYLNKHKDEIQAEIIEKAGM